MKPVIRGNEVFIRMCERKMQRKSEVETNQHEETLAKEGQGNKERKRKKEEREETERERERAREVVRKHVGISGTLRPDQRHENLVRPPCLSTDHIPSPPNFLIQEPYPPGCFGAVVLFARVYIGKQITQTRIVIRPR